MKLIRYRDAGMNTYTYFWKNSEHRVASPYFDTEQEAQEWYGDKLSTLNQAAENMSDKGYELSTHEKQAEFAKNRNYPEWDEWKSIK
jgi:hypothetical protein